MTNGLSSSFSIFLQDHPSLLGGRAEDCEEGFEDSEGKGEASLKELRWEDDKAKTCELEDMLERNFGQRWNLNLEVVNFSLFGV